MRQRCPLSQLLFNIALEFLARAIIQEEEIRKEEVKLALFADDMILYMKELKNSNKKQIDIHKQFQQSSRIQNEFTKQIPFLYTNSKQIEKEYRKTILFTVA
jgi:hypothetical protein